MISLARFVLPFLGTCGIAVAQIPLSPDSLQLQQLVTTSKQQLKTAQELLEYGKRDSENIERSSRLLEKLSAGLERSIEKYQGTATYEKALLKLQSEDAGNPKQEKRPLDPEKTKQRFEAFQSESIKANLSDLNDQQKLSEALRSAEQGFVPKIQTQTQIGSWQASTRLSSQLTELLSVIHGLREDMRGRNQSSNGLAELVRGAELQNQKQREVINHEPR